MESAGPGMTVTVTVTELMHWPPRGRRWRAAQQTSLHCGTITSGTRYARTTSRWTISCTRAWCNASASSAAVSTRSRNLRATAAPARCAASLPPPPPPDSVSRPRARPAHVQAALQDPTEASSLRVGHESNPKLLVRQKGVQGAQFRRLHLVEAPGRPAGPAGTPQRAAAAQGSRTQPQPLSKWSPQYRSGCQRSRSRAQ